MGEEGEGARERMEGEGKRGGWRRCIGWGRKEKGLGWIDEEYLTYTIYELYAHVLEIYKPAGKHLSRTGVSCAQIPPTVITGRLVQVPSLQTLVYVASDKPQFQTPPLTHTCA